MDFKSRYKWKKIVPHLSMGSATKMFLLSNQYRACDILASHFTLKHQVILDMDVIRESRNGHNGWERGSSTRSLEQIYQETTYPKRSLDIFSSGLGVGKGDMKRDSPIKTSSLGNVHSTSSIPELHLTDITQQEISRSQS